MTHKEYESKSQMKRVEILKAEQRKYFGKKIADAIEEALLVPNHHQPGDKLCDSCYTAQRAAIIARGRSESI